MVAKQGDIFPDKELREFVDKELEKRNINEHTVGELIYGLQHKFFPNKTVDEFGEELPYVLKKREVQEVLAIGFALDNLATEKKLPGIVQTIVERDMGEFSTDELLSITIAMMYGGISIANWGRIDTNKFGLAKELDTTPGNVNTFADDLVEALASACAARLGQHSIRPETNDA